MKIYLQRHKKMAIAIGICWISLIILFFIFFLVSQLQTHKYAKQLFMRAQSEKVLNGWNDQSIRNLYKEKWWLEQQLALAKSDSFSLGINLKDSIVQIQLKGTVLVQTKIVKQSPDIFFRNTDERLYGLLFNEISRIDSSSANIPKRPFKKVIAPKPGTESTSVTADTTNFELLEWKFLTSSNIEVLILGVQQNIDTTITDKSNKIAPNGKRFSGKNPLKPQNSIPLTIWLNDQDAKSIYRALPEKANIIFMD